MDVRIHGQLDGIQTAMIIHQTLSEKPRILFLSAHPREQFPHLNALEPATFAYLEKPYSPQDLFAAIQKLLA
jgi:DNA-binding response OmpR family regulator